MDSQKSFDERKKHQINSYLKDIISNVNASDELYILDLLKLNQIKQKNKCWKINYC
jgi:hypothetical protein